MKSIKVLKNSFKLVFCLLCLIVLSGCFGDKPLNENETTTDRPSESNQPVLNPSQPNPSGQSPSGQSPAGSSGSSPSPQKENEGSQNTTSHNAQESFSISSSNKLDILVVLPGGSDEEKGKLGLSLSRMISDTYFQSLDWQVAFISEDPNQNKSDGKPTFWPLKNQRGDIHEPDSNDKIHILTPELQADHILIELVIETMMSSRGNKVQPLISMIQSIGKTENQEFFREDALLNTIVLSKGQDKEEDTPTLGVIASVSNHLGDSKQFVTHGIITEVGDTECAKTQTNDITNFSYAVSTLVDEVGGVVDSICEEDYTSFMTQVESNIQEKLVSNSEEIKLKYTNVVEKTISLTFTPAENAQTWQYDSQESKITFDSPVLSGTTVEVSYDYLTEDDLDL